MDVPKCSTERRATNRTAKHAVEIKEFRAQLSEARGKTQSKDDAAGDCTSSQPQAELAKELRLAKERLAQLAGCDKDFRAVFPDLEARVEQERLAVDTLEENVRGCKPAYQRLLQATRKETDWEKKLAADEKQGKELEEKLALLNKEKQEFQERTAEHAAALDEARREKDR